MRNASIAVVMALVMPATGGAQDVAAAAVPIAAARSESALRALDACEFERALTEAGMTRAVLGNEPVDPSARALVAWSAAFAEEVRVRAAATTLARDQVRRLAGERRFAEACARATLAPPCARLDRLAADLCRNIPAARPCAHCGVVRASGRLIRKVLVLGAIAGSAYLALDIVERERERARR